MESFEIPDSAISASSIYDSNHGAQYGRLRMTKKDGHIGGWSAKRSDKDQWLQIDIGSTTEVTQVKTQGRQDASQWVTSFELSYSSDGAAFHSNAQSKVHSNT